MVDSHSSPCSPASHSQELLDVLGDVVVLVQSESDSDSDSDLGSDTQDVIHGPVTDPSMPVEIDTPIGPVQMVPVAFDPETFPADRVAIWLQELSIPEDSEFEIGSSAPTPSLEGEEDGNAQTLEQEPPMDPETASVLETCTELLIRLDDVRLAVLHLQYSLRVGTAGHREPRPLETQDRAQRLWSWDHAGVFLAELPCP